MVLAAQNYRDTKLIEILSRQYDFILAALEENIFRIGRSREYKVVLAAQNLNTSKFIEFACLVSIV
jgi:hypothetical protein